MQMILDALLPVILITALGLGLARLNLLTGEQWRGVERLAYFILFPAIIVETVARADFGEIPAVGLGLALAAAILIITAALLLLRPLLAARFGVSGPAFTSVYQGVARWNSFIALALIGEMIGAKGLALLAVAMIAMIPMLNVLSVLILSRYAGGSAPTLQRIGLDLLRNPFIVSTLAGLALNLAGNPVPEPVMNGVHQLGLASLPVGILCVGASLDLSALRRPGAALVIGTLARLLLMPALVAGLCHLLGVTGEALLAGVIATAVPSASASYLLAAQMGGDHRLMAEILTVQTVAAIVTIPLCLTLLI
ncbi:AEC family transporter [Microvirga tunisiensis]|uniref:AEC family transporter n=1 Tax=Pannonibacter tanglangensis TaxID=2750084 RepID=A0A7X5J768_9HYPH|nr:AEC family transporter [Pannonibacter sp. XCT-53]NBN77414.1 AEC family transporter [Pannonibacter sp. XCT-53]